MRSAGQLARQTSGHRRAATSEDLHGTSSPTPILCSWGGGRVGRAHLCCSRDWGLTEVAFRLCMLSGFPAHLRMRLVRVSCK